MTDQAPLGTHSPAPYTSILNSQNEHGTSMFDNYSGAMLSHFSGVESVTSPSQSSNLPGGETPVFTPPDGSEVPGSGNVGSQPPVWAYELRAAIHDGNTVRLLRFLINSFD